MENVQTDLQCQHPGCKCDRPSEGDYCSGYCSNAREGGMDNDCKCGHAECER